jgi:Domain of unknown function (DUF5069)
MNYHAPDLTLHPPRSPRVKLGGFVALPRMIDKCRATIAGKNGEYHYDCPLDKRVLSFAGVTADALKAEVAKGKGDGKLLDWITTNSTTKPSEWEILAWSEWQSARVVSDVETRDFFNGLHKQYGEKREDIATWFDLLDLDDYASFGGKA